jgi:choline transport protein
MSFPQVLPATKDNMNHAGPLLGAVIVGALIDWVIGGHKRFKVPTARTM